MTYICPIVLGYKNALLLVSSSSHFYLSTDLKMPKASLLNTPSDLALESCGVYPFIVSNPQLHFLSAGPFLRVLLPSSGSSGYYLSQLPIHLLHASSSDLSPSSTSYQTEDSPPPTTGYLPSGYLL